MDKFAYLLYLEKISNISTVAEQNALCSYVENELVRKRSTNKYIFKLLCRLMSTNIKDHRFNGTFRDSLASVFTSTAVSAVGAKLLVNCTSDAEIRDVFEFMPIREWALREQWTSTEHNNPSSVHLAEITIGSHKYVYYRYSKNIKDTKKTVINYNTSYGLVKY